MLLVDLHSRSELRLRMLIALFFLVYLILVFFFPLVWHAQSSPNNNSVSVEFCSQDDQSNGSRNTYVTVAPGKATDLCVRLSNTTSSPVTVALEFVDGTFTANTKRRSCSGWWVTEAFGQYITNYESTIALSPNQTKTITPRILFPVEKLWEQLWCLAYRVLSPDTILSQDSSGMSVIVRNVQYIDVFVAGDIGTDFTVSPLVLEDAALREGSLFAISRTAQGLVLGLRGENLWWIKQSLTVTAQSIDSTWIRYALPSDSNVLSPNTSSDFVISVPDQPWYNIVRRAEVTVTRSPVLGSIDPTLLDEAVLEPYTVTETLTYRVVPRTYLLIGLLWVLTVFFIIRFARAYTIQARQLAELQSSLAWNNPDTKHTDTQSSR
jgi:hypothetical protein